MIEVGIWQLTSAIDKQFGRVLGHLRLEVDSDEKGAKKAVKDAFYTAVHLLDAQASPEIGPLTPTSKIVLLPRNAGGQHFVVASNQTATAAIEAMGCYNSIGSTMMMVSATCVSCATACVQTGTVGRECGQADRLWRLTG